MASTNAGNITKGSYIMFKDAPYMVMKAEYMAPGKGSPIMRVKMRNAQTGSVQEFTYKTNDFVELADMEKKELQYLYGDKEEVVFMDPKTYEQVSVPVEVLGGQEGLLVADIKCWLLWFGDKVIGVTLPPHVELLVVDAPEGAVGNTVNSPKRLVKLETGKEVLAPLFIKTGVKIIVDTTTGEYVSRAIG